MKNENLEDLIEEYRTVLGNARGHEPEALVKLLIAERVWSPEEAARLIDLAKNYGSFMLRNALAISLVHSNEHEESINGLVEEYCDTLDGMEIDETEKPVNALVSEGDWTFAGAAQLIELANKKSARLLRNALAISLVLGIEDGSLGF